MIQSKSSVSESRLKAAASIASSSIVNKVQTANYENLLKDMRSSAK